MPTFYNFRQNGLDYSFDDIFITADLFRNGNLWGWGSAGEGQLGNTSINVFSTPVTTFTGGTNWKEISAGGYHTAAIKTDGTLWSWGYGFYGINGNASVNFINSTPVTTFAGGTNWKQVSAARLCTVAIKTDGTLWVWGNGGYGRLGTNGLTNSSTPVTTFAGGTDWKQVSTGIRHTTAIKTDGTLWTWGNSLRGRLGNGITTGTVSTPITTFAGGTDWKQVSCGGYHTTVIKTDGTLWTWGGAYNGALGTNDLTDRSTPVTTFAGGTNWKQVSAGGNNTAAIKTDGTLWTWGYGFDGKLGTNGLTDRSTPVTTFAGGTNWKQVSCGFENTAAIKADGTLWTWGSEFSGKLGNRISTNTKISTPVTTFAGGNNWKKVSSGYSHMAALKYDDSVL
jgi:alpha-tubulin suppressor-like RCC1 family protein